MKRIYFLSIISALFIFPFFVSAQTNMVNNGGLEEWDDAGTPTNWDKYENISQEATVVHGGTYSAAQTAPNSSSKKLRQNIPGVIPGSDYTVSYWFLDNDPDAKTRIYSYWLDANGATLDANAEELRPNTYSTDNPNWQQFAVQITAPENAAKFRFEVRSYKGESGDGGGVVYFDDFYFGTEEVILPEPSNYPTEFKAETFKIFIDLSWVNSTGEQLPTGYLIYGVEDGIDFPVPVDGVPVEDDADWSDGVTSGNVPFGISNIRVDGLSPGVSYKFIIYPFTNSGADIDYKTDDIPPTATATTENVSMLSYTDFETGDFDIWQPLNVLGDQEWYISEYNGNSFAKMSGYSSGNHANEDWLISNPIAIDAGREAYFNFDNAFKYDGNPLELYVSTDYDGSGDPNNFTWTDLTDQATWSDGNYNWVFSNDVSLTDYAGQTVYLAFKYTSTDEASSTWELDRLFAYETLATGINETKEVDFNIYPNPVVDNFSFISEDEGVVYVMDLTGKTVMQQQVKRGLNKINAENLTSGVYIVNLKTQNGLNKTQKMIVK